MKSASFPELQIGPHERLHVITSTAELYDVEAHFGPQGRPPPTHLHPAHDEAFEVLAGRLRVEVDGQATEHVAGDRFGVQRGQAHRMWNASDAPTVVNWRSMPARSTESWFRALAGLLEQGNGRIDPLGFAAVATRHRDTYRLVLRGSPWLGAVAVTGLGGLGRLLGRGRPR